MMQRRNFSKMILMGTGMSMVACSPLTILDPPPIGPRNIIKPKALKKGDTIGLIAPASPFTPAVLTRAMDQIAAHGFELKLGKNLNNQLGYLAGKDEERVEDIHSMFEDEEVDAIWCIRGGYGTSRILHYLNYELISKHPKMLIGYSDITALIQAIYLKTGLIGFHGPVGSSTMTAYTDQYFQLVAMNGFEPVSIELNNNHSGSGTNNVYRVITPGEVTGELVGGNLSLLAALAGTEFQMDFTDKLVFIEDVGEKPYRLDRMLTQLFHSCNLAKAKGIILGEFADCEAKEGEFSLSLKDALDFNFGGLEIPVCYGFSFGHISDLCTLPVGILATFNTEKKRLDLLENAVV